MADSNKSKIQNETHRRDYDGAIREDGKRDLEGKHVPNMPQVPGLYPKHASTAPFMPRSVQKTEQGRHHRPATATLQSQQTRHNPAILICPRSSICLGQALDTTNKWNLRKEFAERLVVF